MVTILSFLFVLGFLIFIHELGHFLVAKKVGIKVERFSLGFPPYLLNKKFGDTEYSIGLIPLGGFVKMAGEYPNEGETGAPDEFMSKTIGQRAAVIFAGPFMNYVLTIIILFGVFFSVGRPIMDDTQILVGDVSAEGPAGKAGLVTDDIIIAVDGHSVSSFDTLRNLIRVKVEEPVTVSWIHGVDTITAEMTTMLSFDTTDAGTMDSIGLIGFSQKPKGYESLGIIEAGSSAFETTHYLVIETFRFIKRLIAGEVSAKMLGGPIFIAQESGRQAAKGPQNLFMFMALLSVNLAVLNILPIPVLDGGQLVMLAFEKIRGKAVSMKARAIFQQVGLVVLLSLIVFVTYNDILRMIRNW